MDYTTMTTAEVSQILADAYAELGRRDTISQASARVEQARQEYVTAIGRADGDEFVQPTGYHDAYSLHAEVTWEGATWIAQRAGANGIPGASDDWREKPEEGVAPEWVQPQAHNLYEPGAVVRLDGRLFRNDHVSGNGWRPGAPGSQWTDIGPA